MTRLQECAYTEAEGFTMDEDFMTRLGGFDGVWRRVRATDDDFSDLAVPPAAYGSFCILPDPRQKCHTIRFIPEI